MGNYIDNTYTAIDGIILMYSGKDVSLSIPGNLADMSVTALGKGSFAYSETLQQVVIPDSVKALKEECFLNCKNLMNVYIPYRVNTIHPSSFCSCHKLSNLFFYDIELSEQSYNSLRIGSIPVGNSVFLACRFPDIKVVRDTVASAKAVIANPIPDNIRRLFTSPDESNANGSASINRRLESFGYKSDTVYTTEIEEFMGTPATEDRTFDEESEEKNDLFLSRESVPAISKTAVFTFDDSKTKRIYGKYLIFAKVKIGYHFWQSKVPIVFNGKLYYIYSRRYLCSEPGLNYIRADVGIFDKRGPLSSHKEAQSVYAKYRLLSIL